MNRALTEGRQALAIKLAGIEGGIECAKLAPQLSALADGEARAEDLDLLRPHKAAAIGERAHAVAELATGQKVAAVAASAAALAGGGTAVDQFANHQPPRPPPPEQTVEAKLGVRRTLVPPWSRAHPLKARR